MKTILIPAEDHDSMSSVLEAARLVAKRFDSYMEGFAVHPAAAEYLTVDPLSSLTMPHSPENDIEIERHARGMFEAFMAANDIPRAPAQSDRTATYSYGWVRPTAEADPFIGSYGRLFDLIVLGRPGRSPQDPRMTPLETALFETGRPVLIAPPAPPGRLARNVLVAWNGSTEQARTIEFAVPLLRGAETVTVLSVEGGMTPGPTGEEVGLYLRRNGIPATAVTVAPDTRTTGETIL